MERYISMYAVKTLYLLELDRRRMNMSDIEVGEVFTLSDENNEEQEVEVLGAMDVEGAEYIAVAFVEDIQTETEEDIDIFFLKVEEDSEFSYIENDEEFEKYLLHLKRFWMSKSKNRNETQEDGCISALFYLSRIQRLM